MRYDSDFDTEFKRLAKANIFKPGWEKNAKKMYNLVVIKDMISSIVWYFLTQALIIATSFNGIMNINCIRSKNTLAKGAQLGGEMGSFGKKGTDQMNKEGAKKNAKKFLINFCL